MFKNLQSFITSPKMVEALAEQKANVAINIFLGIVALGSLTLAETAVGAVSSKAASVVNNINVQP